MRNTTVIKMKSTARDQVDSGVRFEEGEGEGAGFREGEGWGRKVIGEVGGRI